MAARTEAATTTSQQLSSPDVQLHAASELRREGVKSQVQSVQSELDTLRKHSRLLITGSTLEHTCY